MALNPKEILFGQKARARLMEGVDLFAQAIGARLGAKKKGVGLGPFCSSPKMTDDLDRIGADLKRKDPYIDLGMRFGKEMVHQIRRDCGDGATTGALLLNALVREGVYLMAQGMSPIEIKHGIDQGVQAVLGELDSLSIGAKGAKAVEVLEDSELRQVIGNALSAVTHSMFVRIEEGEGMGTFLKKIEGTCLYRGYLSRYFCTDGERIQVKMDDVSVLLTDQKIESVQQILPILLALASRRRGILIVAEKVEKDVLATLVMNRLKGLLQVAAIEIPPLGNAQREVLEDLACLTGGCVVSKDKGMRLKEVGAEVLGSAEKVEISRQQTMILGNRGSKKRIRPLLEQISQQIRESSSQEDRRRLKKRRDRLIGRMAVIYVGGSNKGEREEKKEHFEKGLKVVQAAQEGGVVPGGGVALLRAAQILEDFPCKKGEKQGVLALQRACQVPFKQIVANAGRDSSLYLKKVLSQKKGMGFHALTEQVEDLTQAGVIDPTKIVKHVLKTAASIAGKLLLSEVIVVEPLPKGRRST